jgi:galactokinase
MTNNERDKAKNLFKLHFRTAHSTCAFAPGRVEVLGNHTDYNEGFVLSAAIDMGTFFLAAPSNDTSCRLVAADIDEEVTFDISNPAPSTTSSWSNYVKGVLAGLRKHAEIKIGFLGMFLGNIPLGAGLSSSAALETSTALALCSLYDIRLPSLQLAKIGQKAEHQYAGVKCGLLDQISSLFGKEKHLVMTDFRSLAVTTVPLSDDARFLMCNTAVKHSLVDSEYNERREKCEQAAEFFAGVLNHPVSALRDVDWSEWEQYSPDMDDVTARRAAHVIGENSRVLKGNELLEQEHLEDFGKLMFESHRSSRENFENSCPELDFIVDTASKTPGALGARLSGGGFGGSAVILVHSRDADMVAKALASAYAKKFDHPCDIRLITPSNGARVV